MTRKLQFQPLEPRRLMVSNWHNASLPCDVDSSGLVEPLDAIIVINDLNLNGTRQTRRLGILLSSNDANRISADSVV